MTDRPEEPRAGPEPTPPEPPAPAPPDVVAGEAAPGPEVVVRERAGAPAATDEADEPEGDWGPEGREAPPPAPPPGPGRRRLGVAVVVLVPLLVLVTAPLLPFLVRTLRQQAIDGATTLAAPAGTAPELLDEAARVLRRRLDAAGLPSRVRREGEAVVVEHLQRDAAELGRLLAPGRVAFQLLVEPGPDLSALELQQELRRLLDEQARGLPPDPKFEVASWRDEYVGGSGPALLERPGVDGELADAYETLDERGLPALGVRFTDRGRQRFAKLTRKNIGRRLAIVLDGRVHGAPWIRSEIGARAIVEGGETGFDPVELRAWCAILTGGPLPVPLAPAR